ncbi:MAG: VWA domain-containing protein [Bacteroidales bacterium]|jgi:Ca-activated chloride channel family protein|nr:VWA domain-containing protein [Bacteroidales bacterium]
MIFNIENPSLLYALFAIVLLALYFLYYMQKKRNQFKTLGDLELVRSLMPDYSIGKQYVKYFTLILVFALLIFALANPQMGTTVKKAERKGADIMIALDISNSMNSEDVQPSRLARAKQSIISIVDKLHGDRIGLVVFAGNAYMQLPLTSDYSAAKLFVSNVSTDDISAQGTAIGSAIELCLDNFEKSDDEFSKGKRNKAIIIISDGENFEDDALGAAQLALDNGVVVHTVGMGTPEGGPIPLARGGGYKKDNSGNVVMTHLNEDMLAQIASHGSGEYVGANSSAAGAGKILALVEKLDKVQFGSRDISGFETRYQYVVILALLLLLADIFIFERKHKVFNRRNIFGAKQLALFLLLMFAGVNAGVQAQVARTTQKGNILFEQKKFDNATEEYLRSLSIDSNYRKARYNLGNSQYKQGQYEQAVQTYQNVLNNKGLKKDEMARTLYNLGNAQLKQQQYEEAIKSYIESLKLQPGNEDTKYNLAYAKQKLMQQQQQQQNQDNKENKDNKDNKDNKQNQNKNDQNKDNKDKQQNQQNQNQDQNKDKQDQQQKQQQQQQQRQRQKEQQDKAKAEQTLRAFENQEKNTLDKVKKKTATVPNSKTDKDW